MAGSPVELIKEKLDIVEFLKEYLPLQPAGRNFKTLCPFHREKTPSFMISPERQSWHCFGCGIGGDIFGFLMRYENVEFGEALRTLAEKAGVELRRTNPAEYKYAGLLYDLNDAAKNFFRDRLAEAPAARAYLKERGLADATVEEFEIGWAPNEPDALTLHFLNGGSAPDDLTRAGLILRTERGMHLDRFRGRIMFPIHNHLGKVVGFTGRVLPQFETGEAGKYMNSPETPIFGKSKLLYGFWKSKNPIREAGNAFLVEGQMDFLMSWQAGVRNTVASSGTALTPDHLRALRRVTQELVVSFDSDDAGREAGERAIDLAEANDFTVRVVTFADYKDPAEAAVADPARLSAMVRDARPAMEFYFEKYLPAGSVAWQNRDGLRRLRAVLAKITNMASPVVRGFWVRELSRRTGIEERLLIEETERVETKRSVSPSRAPDQEERERAAPPSRWELLSQRLLGVALARGDFDSVGDATTYLMPHYRKVFDLLKQGARDSEDPEIDERIHLTMLSGDEGTSEEVEELKTHLVREYSKEHRRELTERVKHAEASGDEAALQKVLGEFNELPAP